jgi:hypothetical protein
MGEPSRDHLGGASTVDLAVAPVPVLPHIDELLATSVLATSVLGGLTDRGLSVASGS